MAFPATALDVRAEAIIVSHMLHRKAIATHMDKLRNQISAHLHPPDEGTPRKGGK